MKHSFAFVTAALAVTLATPVAAQRTVRAQPDIALQAEHQVWQAEHDRWEGEHRTAAQRLRAIAERLEKPEGDALSRHRVELGAHGGALSGRADPAALASAHARLRASHEEVRDAHHHLMDQVRELEAVASEDTQAGTAEAAPR